MWRRWYVAVGKCGYLLEVLYLLCENCCRCGVEGVLQLGNVDIYWRFCVYCVEIAVFGA